MKVRLATLFVLALPATAVAQGVAAAKGVYDIYKNFLIRSADQMPEANYSFKPTPAVRSFGEIIGHVANSNYGLCAIALGQKNPSATQDFEKNTEKTALVKALKDSFAYCDGAYQISDAASTGQVEFEGMKGSKVWLLNFNTAHDSEHYGNLVTYFRLKGMVPPSSQKSSGR